MSFQNIFKALSDPIRRDILIMLKNGKMSAGEIAENFEISAPSISYHLNQLKKADLIDETKFKNYIYYELNLSVFEEVMFWLSNFKDNKKENLNEKENN